MAARTRKTVARDVSRETASRTFRSLVEMIEFAKGPCDMPDYLRSSETVEYDRDGFYGTRTLSAAFDIAHNWRDGAARVERARASLKVSSRGVKREVFMRQAGPGAMSMAAIAADMPRPYVVLRDTVTPKQTAGKVVRVHVNIAASSGIGTDVIERRGAAVLQLVQALEAAGRRCEIVVGQAITSSSYGQKMGGTYVVRCTVKRAEARLNLNSIAFALAHPAMLRRLVFAVEEREPENVRTGFGIGSGYGIPAEFRAPAGAIYIGRMLGTEATWNTPESAAQWVREQAAAQGVVIR